MPQLTIELPGELSAALVSSGQDLSRAAFEAIALEAYRERKLSTAQLRRLLGFQTRMEVDGFLKAHGVELESAAKIWNAIVKHTADLGYSGPSNGGYRVGHPPLNYLVLIEAIDLLPGFGNRID